MASNGEPAEPTRESTLYHYCPLAGKDWIRILHLQPAALRSARLECHISHYQRLGQNKHADEGDQRSPTMKNTPLQEDATDGINPLSPYEAVSYAWGDADTDARIHVLASAGNDAKVEIKESVLMITHNVEEMLRTFRSDTDIVNLWLDAVCLNQKDKDELGHQIAAMGEIFGQAPRTRVWLGLADEDTANVITFLGLCRTLDVKEAALRAFGLHGPEPVSNFLGRPWFTRRWIVQELVLSRNPVFFLGGQTFAYRNAEPCFGKLHFAVFRNQITLRKKARHALNMISLSDLRSSSLLLRLFRHSESLCLDAKDRLLAFRGLSVGDHMWVAQAQKFGKESWMYDMTWQDFYKCVSRYYLQSIKTSRVVLCHAASFGNLADLDILEPSWCPAWHLSLKPGAHDWEELWDFSSCFSEHDYNTSGDGGSNSARVATTEVVGHHTRNTISVFDKQERMLLVRQHVLNIFHVELGDVLTSESRSIATLEKYSPRTRAAFRKLKQLCDLPDYMTLDYLLREHISNRELTVPDDLFGDLAAGEDGFDAKRFQQTYNIFFTRPCTVDLGQGRQEQCFFIGALDKRIHRHSICKDSLVLVGDIRNMPADFGVAAQLPFARPLQPEERKIASRLCVDNSRDVKETFSNQQTNDVFVGRLGGAVSISLFGSDQLRSAMRPDWAGFEDWRTELSNFSIQVPTQDLVII